MKKGIKPEKIREIIQLSEDPFFSIRQIADQTGVSETTVKRYRRFYNL